MIGLSSGATGALSRSGSAGGTGGSPGASSSGGGSGCPFLKIAEAEKRMKESEAGDGGGGGGGGGGERKSGGAADPPPRRQSKLLLPSGALVDGADPPTGFKAAAPREEGGVAEMRTILDRHSRMRAPSLTRASATARRNSARLSALLGGSGLHELEDLEPSSFESSPRGGRKARLLLPQVSVIREESKLLVEEDKDSDPVVGGLSEKKEDTRLHVRYGPYPKSAPVPDITGIDEDGKEDNKEDQDAGAGEAEEKEAPTPWNVRTYGGPDDRDAGTPDEWIARHKDLERLAGRHPFNAEPDMKELRSAGFITPGHLHFVRNHGAVPRLSWDEHEIEVRISAGHARGGSSGSIGGENGGKDGSPAPYKLNMDGLTSLPGKELPVTLACIGNRRSEQNAIRRTIGFSWGTGAVSTSVFRGLPLRTLLLNAGVSEDPADWEGCHVEFVGADDLPNKVGPGPFEDEDGAPWGKRMNYGTSVPLGKAMDPARDMLLAYEANGEPLPPDHGYPVRVVVPGSTGGRWVKWLCQVNVLPHESHNLYHHHDNKILPPHVQDLESSLSPEKRWWYQSEYIVHELNINSAVILPGHGDTFEIDNADDMLDVSGYAYAGGGRRITRVEVSLDSGSNWDLADLTRTEVPTSHDMHWCWIFWSARVPARLLLDSGEVWCRAWDETNNTQPDHPTWNLMGLGNNCVYRVKVHAADGGRLTFEHPTRPGSLEGGWMKVPGGLPESAGFGRLKSKEEQEEDARAEAEEASRELKRSGRVLTMEEVKAHNSKDDVWIVVRNRVYDCTEYLESHPGGLESIVIYAGRDCSKDFAAVHSVGANKLLEEYYIGDLDEADAVDSESAEDADALVSDDDITVGLDEDDPVVATVSRCLDKLDELYGVSTGSEDPFSIALVTSGWSKVLANEDGFSEALLGRWRLLVAMEEIFQKEEELNRKETHLDASSRLGESDMDETEYALRMAGIDRDTIAKFEATLRGARTNRRALDEVRNNDDPIALCLGSKLAIAKDLLIGMLDAAVGALRPSVSRESRFGDVHLERLGLISGTVDEYAHGFNRCGIQPEYWIMFCEAFLWSMSTHVPTASATDLEDLGKSKEESAYASFVSNHVARYVTTSLRETKEQFHAPAFIALRRFQRSLSDAGEEAAALIGETFYQTAFTTYPDLVQYFPHTDMDAQALHVMGSISMIIETTSGFGAKGGPWHDKVNHLNNVHKNHQIPTNTYQMIGGNFLKVLRPFFKQEAEKWKNSRYKVTTEDLISAFSTLYVEVMGEVSASMIVQEKIVTEAEEFITSAAKELIWSEDKLNTRLLEVKLEVASHDTYEQTQEEIEIGACIAWRNAAKCVNRGMWGDLTVWDRRGFDTYDGMAQVVLDHLKAVANSASGPIMVLFGEREKHEMLGTRFWSPSYMEYAGYKEDDDTVMGDPKNVEYTHHLIKHGLWEAPQRRSEFDLLPVVLKIPGQSPFAITIPDELRREVKIEHPSCDAINKLGLRWPAFLVSSKFNLSIGGVQYPCGAYSRSFVSTEVVRGLCSRSGLTEKLANVMGISSSERLRRKRVWLEMEVAVLHSFMKQDCTIFEEDSTEALLEAHSKKELEAGRECPIKGESQVKVDRPIACFETCCDSWRAMEATNNASAGVGIHSSSNSKTGGEALKLPKVLIAFGSETGTAEGAAMRLSRALKLLKPTVMSLNDVAECGIINEQDVTHFIVICSTFNRGEFPHNAHKFADSPLTSDALVGTKAAVLALGSSIYPDFCLAGVKLEAMLEGAGAKFCIPFTKVDSASGSEGPISEWLELAKAVILPKHLAAMIRGGSSQEEETPVQNEMIWMAGNEDTDAHSVAPFSWPEDDSLLCIGNEELMEVGDIETRSTRRITFQLPAGIRYESGDHLSVMPLNSLSMVKRFALCFRDELVDAAAAFSGSCPLMENAGDESVAAWLLQQPFEIQSFDGPEEVQTQLVFDTPAILSDVLQARVDLTLHSGQLKDLLALSTGSLRDCDGALKEGLSDENMDKIQNLEEFASAIQSRDTEDKESAFASFLFQYPTIVNFLEENRFLCERHESEGDMPATLLKLADLLVILPRQQARYYSISSSPMTQPSTVSISVGVVHVTTNAGVVIHGVCSNYLARLSPSKDRVQASVRTSTFRGPLDVNDPVIMIGPGTGLAPMMGFLQDRAHILSSSESKPDSSHLFFGCRTRDDRIYGKLIDKWESEGILNHHLALSRSEEMPKTYVQDLMSEMGEDLYNLLLCDTTSVYICGDSSVANHCFEVCVETLRKYGRRSRVSAVMHLKKMRSEHRWQYDLWGTVTQFNEVRKRSVHGKESMFKSASKWLETFG